jgi:hypothetical protein
MRKVNMKNAHNVALTLHQEALSHGFRTMAEVAKAGRVSDAAIYCANLGTVPKPDICKKIAKAIANGPRPGPFTVDDLLACIDAGRAIKAAKARGVVQ